METLRQDVRVAMRSLRRTPGVFAAAVITIALGVGATTAIFTVVDRVVLRPLPFPDSERAVLLCETHPRVGDRCVASPANVADWAQAVPALDAVGVARTEAAVVRIDGRSLGVSGGIVTPGFFQALGVQPARGRLLDARDLPSATNHVAVISDAFWRQRLNSRDDIVGQTMTVNDRACEIVGILRPDVYLADFETVQIWLPLTASVDDTTVRGWRGFEAIGRRASTATAAQLRSQLDGTRAALARAYPQDNAEWGVRVEPLRDHVAGPIRSTLWLFFVAVGLVLVIACVNVASLLLVRAQSRRTEFALRASLGAGRGRLVRQLLTESAVMATAGGLVGWWLGALATRALVQLAPADIPRLTEVQPDARIAMFTVAITAVTALLFGLAPARAASQVDAAALKSSRQVGGSARTRAVLVVAELTLSVVLLSVAGLLGHAFARRLAWDPGFDRSAVRVAWAYVSPGPGINTRTAVDVLEEVRAAVRSIPGVREVGLGSAGPLFGGTESGTLERATASTGATGTTVNWHDIDAHYVDALGRRVLLGRNVTDADVEGAPAVALVSASLARVLSPDGNPIGQTVTVQQHPSTIVGVLSDVRPTRPDLAPPLEIFWPIAQYPRLAAYLVVRAGDDAADLDRTIAARAAALPRVQVSSVTPLDRAFARTLVSPRFNVLLIVVFAAVALVLAAVGVYGVLAQTVGSRTREIGLRIALGASPAQVRRSIVAGALTLAGVGLGLGLALALASGHLLATWLEGLSPADPIVLGGTLALVLVVALIASDVPARRASRVDPLVALRPD